MKELAYRTASGKHSAIFEATVSAYQLDGTDREQFVPSIRELIAEGRIKDVSTCAVFSYYLTVTPPEGRPGDC